MLHQQKTLRDPQQQLQLLQKTVQEKDSHITREHVTCVQKQIGNLSLQINKLEWNIQSILTQQEQPSSQEQSIQKEINAIQLQLQADHIAKHQKQHTQQQIKEAKRKLMAKKGSDILYEDLEHESDKKCKQQRQLVQDNLEKKQQSNKKCMCKR